MWQFCSWPAVETGLAAKLCAVDNFCWHSARTRLHHKIAHFALAGLRLALEHNAVTVSRLSVHYTCAAIVDFQFQIALYYQATTECCCHALSARTALGLKEFLAPTPCSYSSCLTMRCPRSDVVG